MAHSDLYGTAVFADSPLAWYRLDETSGTAAADESGNGHAGTHTAGVVVNQATMLSEGVGKSAQYANVFGARTALDTLGTLGANIQTASFEFLIRTSDTTGPKAVFGTVNTGGSIIVACYVNSQNEVSVAGSLELHMRDAGGVNTLKAYAAVGINDGNPHHVVWVVTSSTTVQLWVDGVQRTVTYAVQQAISGTNFGWPMSLGARNNRNTFDRSLDAWLDEVAFYSTRLSSTRIQAHAAAFKSVPLGGSSAGTSTDTGGLAAQRPLAGSSAGSSTDSGDIAASRPLAGTSAGASSDTGNLAGVLGLAGSSAGTSSDTGNLAGVLGLGGASAGASSDTGDLHGIFTLGGTSAGSSFDTGEFAGGPKALGGTSAGTSSDTGDLRAILTLAGTSAGSSSSTGDLAATLTLAGTSDGASADTGDLAGELMLAGVSAGGSLDTGDLAGGGSGPVRQWPTVPPGVILTVPAGRATT